MEWSTKPHQNDQPFGSWADDLAAAFVRLEPRKIAEHPFEGTISRADSAPIQISRVTATKHRVLRLRSHIARSRDDLCFVNLQLEGVGRYTQRAHQQICGPGDLAVADTTEPSPSGIPAFTGAHIVDLIAHASEVLAERPSERVNPPVLLSMMLDYIDRHSDDPDLGAATLAVKFRCSERYVHRLFSTTDRSVGEHVNDKRILDCTRKLLDHDCRNKTIAEIAFTAGFRDISHFNRLFKRSNGTAPREFRRAMSPKPV